MARSAPINVVRYSNGTLVKLTATAHEFVSYDYDPEKAGSESYSPASITITPSFRGDVKFGKWMYSSDGKVWSQLTTSTDGITGDSSLLTISPKAAIFGEGSGIAVIKCIGDDETYYDTITIERTVDPVIVYRKAKTSIDQNKEKIALIASDTQLKQFKTNQTMVDKMASIEVKADAITSTVSKEYATKTYAETQASNALASAKTDATTKANNALESAKTDATTKANKALSDAKADATTKANAAQKNATDAAAADATKKADNALSAAKTDATTKADEAKSSAIETASADATTKANKALADAKADTDEKLKSYSTTVQMNSAINQKAESITATVSGTYVTKANAIQSTTKYYLLTDLSSGVKTSTSGWTTTPQTATKDKKYVWTYEKYTKADGTTYNSTPEILDVLGVTSIVPLYYSSSSSTTPSAPTSRVAVDDIGQEHWTLSMPKVTKTYPYLYICQQILYQDGKYSWTSVELDRSIEDIINRISRAELKITDDTIVSTVRKSSEYKSDLNGKTSASDVESIIEQKADSIRLKAKKISWKSDKSSMSEDGHLECEEAKINGNFVTEEKWGNGNKKTEIYEGVIKGYIRHKTTDEYSQSGLLDMSAYYEDEGKHISLHGFDQLHLKSDRAISIEVPIDGNFSEIASVEAESQNFNLCNIGAKNNILKMRSSSGGELQVQIAGSLVIDEFCIVRGIKPRLITTYYGDRLQYCYETPTPQFGDIGFGVIDENGECFVSIDDIFAETVNLNIEYAVFLQKEGAGDLWVDTKEASYFIVKGTPGLHFSWELKAVQRDFENLRLDDYDLYMIETADTSDLEADFDKELKKYDIETEEMLYESIESFSGN